ncbi:phage tail sheath subtilisin-like domain-containing protein [Tepidimonas taiwanensis]|uniref:Putative prophage major tail sheath protein n=1 Tax=Tepidimonas taiwanensis TaxID=307486 RepID=A0A554XC39_9BURK|nr:phage tail sheath subtilisin-like domain-containing protein [Tepidimonas taiwanensis]TSE33407.1 putative prophage major tail sheath protein [Tepidimonas taiwanensis]UBQ04447.1 phage tail sheath subtilisin-like domain-containing protein [Tepidimonas taiwanensis]
MSEAFHHGVEVVEIDNGVRPIQTARSSVIGIVGTAPAASDASVPLNTPILLTTPRSAAILGGTGTLPAAVAAIHAQGYSPLIVAIRVADVADDPNTTAVNERLEAIIGGTDAGTGARTGIAALETARSVLGVVPRILLAPGFSQHKTVADALIAQAIKLRAVALIDGPNSTSAAAIAYRAQFDSSRAYLIDPWAVVDGSVVPVSPHVAGLIAKIDNERGFWWSPSNNPLLGIDRPARPIDFGLGRVDSEANLLNEPGVATLITEQGIRLWGNRTCSSDPKWAFLSVRRTADMIHESMLQAHLWAVDRAVGKAYIRDVQESVNAYLRHLKSVGAILGGRCWLDEELNTPANLAAGKVYFDFDFTPPAPAERVTFRSHLVADYAAAVFEQ